jgi:predicted glycosyltransferase
LEEKYKLGYGFQTNQESEMLQKVAELLQNKNLKAEFIHLGEKMLADKIDLANFINKILQDFIEE